MRARGGVGAGRAGRSPSHQDGSAPGSLTAIRYHPPPIAFRHALLLALGVIVLFVLQAYLPTLSSGQGFIWYHGAGPTVINYLLWAFMSPLISTLTFGVLGHERPDRRALVAFGLLSVPLAVLHRTLFLLIYYPRFHYVTGMSWSELLDRGLESLPPMAIGSLVELWIIAFLFVAIQWQRRWRRNELELLDTKSRLQGARLDALRMQLQPHFLFNALHTISSLMGKNDKGQRVLSRLGELLRTMLETEATPNVPLEREITSVRNYLDIEEIRFEDRLRVTYDIEPPTLACLVPTLILQPMVENAIKHGFSDRAEGGSIHIGARRRGGRLELVVTDDGLGCADVDAIWVGPGIGLSNARRRLELLHGDQAELTLSSRPGGGFACRMEMPCMEAPDERAGA